MNNIQIDESNKSQVVLSQSFIKNLTDKNHERRQSSQQSLSDQSRSRILENKHENLEILIDHFEKTFIKNNSLTNRKGGLFALAAIFLCMQEQDFFRKDVLSDRIINIMINLMSDFDSKVKLIALEHLSLVMNKSDEILTIEIFYKIQDKLTHILHESDLDLKNQREKIEELLKKCILKYQKLDSQKMYEYLISFLDNNNKKVVMYSMYWIEMLEKRSDCQIFNYSQLMINILMKLVKDKDKNFIDVCNRFVHNTFIPSIASLISNNIDIVTVDLQKTIVFVLEFKLEDQGQHMLARDIIITTLNCRNSFINNIFVNNLDKVLIFINSFIFFEMNLQNTPLRIKHGSFQETINTRMIDVVKDYSKDWNNENYFNSIKIITDVMKEFNNNTQRNIEISKRNTLKWILTLFNIFYERKSILNVLNDENTQIFRICDTIYGINHTYYQDLINIFVLLKENNHTQYFFVWILKSLDSKQNNDENDLDNQYTVIMNLFEQININQFLLEMSQTIINIDLRQIVILEKLGRIFERFLTQKESVQFRSKLSTDDPTFYHLFTIMCQCPMSLITLSLIFKEYNLAYHVLWHRSDHPPTIREYKHLKKISIYYETPNFIFMRQDCFNKEKNQYIIEFLKLLMQTLPQGEDQQRVKKRIKSIKLCCDEVGKPIQFGKHPQRCLDYQVNWLKLYKERNIILLTKSKVDQEFRM